MLLNDSNNREQLRQEFNKHHFDFDCTFGTRSQKHFTARSTARPVYSVWTAHELYTAHLPKLLRQLNRSNQQQVKYLAFIEYGFSLGRPHIHMLIGNVSRLTAQSVINTWENMGGGRAMVRPFNRDKDTGYAYKTLTDAYSTRAGCDHEVLWDTNLWSRSTRKGDSGVARGE